MLKYKNISLTATNGGKNMKNISVLLNAFIGVCGILSLFAWLNIDNNVPAVGTILLPNGNQTIKSNINSKGVA